MWCQKEATFCITTCDPLLPFATVVEERLCFYRCLSVRMGRCTPLRKTPLPGRRPPGRHPLGRHTPGQTPQMTTAADGTHPTGMHSCYSNKLIHLLIQNSKKNCIDCDKIAPSTYIAGTEPRRPRLFSDSESKIYANIIKLFEFFRIEFYRIYRIYRICRRLFVVIFILKTTKNRFLQIL